MHNTLASSDYGLLDENTLAPRPNYWAALLWRKFMGTTVLDAGASPAPTLHLYAHCLRGQPGGVALLAINTDRAASHSLELKTAAERYTLSTPSAQNLEDTHVQLNGTELKLGADDALPQLAGASTQSRERHICAGQYYVPGNSDGEQRELPLEQCSGGGRPQTSEITDVDCRK